MKSDDRDENGGTVWPPAIFEGLAIMAAAFHVDDMDKFEELFETYIHDPDFDLELAQVLAAVSQTQDDVDIAEFVREVMIHASSAVVEHPQMDDRVVSADLFFVPLDGRVCEGEAAASDPATVAKLGETMAQAGIIEPGVDAFLLSLPISVAEACNLSPARTRAITELAMALWKAGDGPEEISRQIAEAFSIGEDRHGDDRHRVGPTLLAGVSIREHAADKVVSCILDVYTLDDMDRDDPASWEKIRSWRDRAGEILGRDLIVRPPCSLPRALAWAAIGFIENTLLPEALARKLDVSNGYGQMTFAVIEGAVHVQATLGGTALGPAQLPYALAFPDQEWLLEMLEDLSDELKVVEGAKWKETPRRLLN